MLILVIPLGAIFGSFLSAYTYRAPRSLQISRGRSFCPRCKAQIAWYDNIPLLSYLLLRGRCRRCHKHISLRYPALELSTALLFAAVYLAQPRIAGNLSWLALLPDPLITGYLLLVTCLLVAVFVTDLEGQLILDQTIFLGYLITFALLIYASPPGFWTFLFSGFLAAFSLLLLHLLTKGRGMGLGDVKLALFLGTILSFPAFISWLLLAFILGALVGLILLGLGKKRLRDRIAFGPFLVIAFFIVLFYANQLNHLFFPFLL